VAIKKRGAPGERVKGLGRPNRRQMEKRFYRYGTVRTHPREVKITNTRGKSAGKDI